MTRINVIDGDIVDVKAQALVTAINPMGYWYGGVDSAIVRAAKGMFHGQAQKAMPLKDGQIVYARQTGPHHGEFDDVLFVVDELKTKLYSLVSNTLRAAAYHDITSVSIPLIRTGVMANVAEQRQFAVEQLGLAVRDFADDDTLSINEITVVVYHNQPDYEHMLRRFALV